MCGGGGGGGGGRENSGGGTPELAKSIPSPILPLGALPAAKSSADGDWGVGEGVILFLGCLTSKQHEKCI